MKSSRAFALIVLLFVMPGGTFAQKLSLGLYSGINISDIHGNNPSGYWKFKPGPVSGLAVDYSFSRYFGLSSGLRYSSVYYEYEDYSDPWWINPSPFMKTILPGDVMYSYDAKMDYGFLTIPLQARISIPSKPGLNLSGGIYYSYLTSHSTIYQEDQPSWDFGYIYSAGISWPFSHSVTGFLNAGYMTGRKEYQYYDDFRQGSMDFTLGIAYTGFFGNSSDKSGIRSDSVSPKISILYKGGVNFSWNRGGYHPDKYSSSTGPSLGFMVNVKLARGVSFQTGLSYERTGYSLSDSSNSFFMHTEKPPAYSSFMPVYYDVSTKVDIDYIVIPALINFYFGKSELVYINTGPYLGLRLNAHVKGTAYNEVRYQSGYTHYKTTVNDDLEAVIKANDFGWIAGGGVNIPVSGKLFIDLGLQYRVGMVDVYNKSYYAHNEYPEADNSVIMNGSLTFSAGIRIPAFR